MNVFQTQVITPNRETIARRLLEQEATIQRLTTEARCNALAMTEMEGQLARTQEWLERFQGSAASEGLDVLRVVNERDELRAVVRSMRALLVEVDRYLISHTTRGTDDLDLRRRIHPYVAARGGQVNQGGVSKLVHEAASKAVDSGPAGSTPAAPTGAVQVSPCPFCGSARTMSGNVASCLACGGTTRPYGPAVDLWCSGCSGCSECKPL